MPAVQDWQAQKTRNSWISAKIFIASEVVYQKPESYQSNSPVQFIPSVIKGELLSISFLAFSASWMQDSFP